MVPWYYTVSWKSFAKDGWSKLCNQHCVKNSEKLYGLKDWSHWPNCWKGIEQCNLWTTLNLPPHCAAMSKCCNVNVKCQSVYVVHHIRTCLITTCTTQQHKKCQDHKFIQMKTVVQETSHEVLLKKYTREMGWALAHKTRIKKAYVPRIIIAPNQFINPALSIEKIKPKQYPCKSKTFIAEKNKRHQQWQCTEKQIEIGPNDKAQTFSATSSKLAKATIHCQSTEMPTS